MSVESNSNKLVVGSLRYEKAKTFTRRTKASNFQQTSVRLWTTLILGAVSAASRIEVSPSIWQFSTVINSNSTGVSYCCASYDAVNLTVSMVSGILSTSVSYR